MKVTNFKFKTKPYQHQLDEFINHAEDKFRALFWEQGTGKTKTLLDQAAYLYKAGKINYVVIIAPKTTDANWVEEEIPRHLALDKEDYSTAVYRSGMSKKRKEAFSAAVWQQPDKLQIMAMNYEAVITLIGGKLLEKVVGKYDVFCILDESTAIGEPKAKTTKKLMALGGKFKYRRIATGTPFTAGPLKIWSQMRFLHPKVLDEPFVAFRARYAILKEKEVERAGRMVVIKFPVGYRQLDHLNERVTKYASRILKKDCLDLPEKIYKRMTFDMPQDLRKEYEQMKERLFITLNKDNYLIAKSQLTKLLYLARISGGYAEGVRLTKTTNDKLKWLRDNISNYTSSGKVIIWGRFVDEIKAIHEEIDGSALVYGETKDKDRKEILDQFRDPESGINILVSNPAVTGISRGLTLTIADTQIFYSNSFRLEDRLQAEDRIHRSGQKKSCLYIDLVYRKSVDEFVLDNLMNKVDLSNKILKEGATWLTSI